MLDRPAATRKTVEPETALGHRLRRPFPGDGLQAVPLEAIADEARLSETGGAPLSLAEAAALAHLSPSRFRHLFVAETGTSFCAYALWVRIQRAVVAMMAGRSWTDAAHAAGFADSAHLSQTFRRRFGISPNMLVRDR